MSGLLQERYSDDPWKVLVVCILLNQTDHEQVEPVVEGLFAMWPTPSDLAHASLVQLTSAVTRLGLANRRVDLLVSMSKAYSEGKPLEELPGVGRYALEAVRMLCDKDHSFWPQDKRLRTWLFAQKLSFQPEVYKNGNGRIAIVLVSTKDKTAVIITDYTAQPKAFRDVLIVSTRKFDEEWDPLDYDVAQAASNFLKAESYIALSPRAKEALQMVVAINRSTGKVVGKFANMELALKTCETGTRYVESAQEVQEKFTCDELVSIINQLVPEGEKVEKFEDHGKAAKKVWTALKKADVPVTKVEKASAASKPAKVSDRDKIRAFCAKRNEFTIQEIADLTNTTTKNAAVGINLLTNAEKTKTGHIPFAYSKDEKKWKRQGEQLPTDQLDLTVPVRTEAAPAAAGTEAGTDATNGAEGAEGAEGAGAAVEEGGENTPADPAE